MSGPIKLEAFKLWMARFVYPANKAPSVWRNALWAIPLSDPLRLRADPVEVLGKRLKAALEKEEPSEKDYQEVRRVFAIADPHNLSKDGYRSLFFQKSPPGRGREEERARLVAKEIASAILTQSHSRQALWESYMSECSISIVFPFWVGFQLRLELESQRAQLERAQIAKELKPAVSLAPTIKKTRL